METRPRNKTTHPGLPDLPTPPKRKQNAKGAKKNAKKDATEDAAIQQLSEELAQIENESAADYANSKTPGAPPRKSQQKKDKNTKKHTTLGKGAVDGNTSQDTDDLNDGSDVERTTRKKKNSASTEFRNNVQSMRKLPGMELNNIEEAEPEGHDDAPSQGSKGVEGGKGKNTKNNKKGVGRKAASAKGKVTQTETSDVEMQGKYPLNDEPTVAQLSNPILDIQAGGIGRGAEPAKRIVSASKRQHLEIDKSV